MIKVLLSLVIWLRKYQGRGGNYYTISNASAILAALFVAVFGICLFPKGKNNLSNEYERGIKIVLLLLSGLLLFFIQILRLCKLLKNKEIFIHYKQHRVNLYLLLTLCIVVVLIFIALQFKIWLMVFT